MLPLAQIWPNLNQWEHCPTGRSATTAQIRLGRLSVPRSARSFWRWPNGIWAVALGPAGQYSRWPRSGQVSRIVPELTQPGRFPAGSAGSLSRLLNATAARLSQCGSGPSAAVRQRPVCGSSPSEPVRQRPVCGSGPSEPMQQRPVRTSAAAARLSQCSSGPSAAAPRLSQCGSGPAQRGSCHAGLAGQCK